jgi:DNA modification methylase
MSIRLPTGDCRETLPTLATGSVQAVITSPPYYGLRDYGTPPLVWGGDAEHEHEWDVSLRSVERGAGTWTQAANGTELRTGVHQTRFKGDVVAARATERENVVTAICSCGAWLGSLGLEPTPELFIEHLVEVFRHVRRVLRDDGVLWLNLGDSYAGSGKGPSNSLQSEASQLSKQTTNNGSLHSVNTGLVPSGLKPKDLMMMPFRVAMALQNDGWYLRSVIPWLKRNSMPESVTDRPATAVEYVFLLSKSSKYFWDADAVRVPNSAGSFARYKPGEAIPTFNKQGGSDRATPTFKAGQVYGRNRRNSDWFMESWQGLLLDDDGDPLALVVNPAPFTGSHFATFPPKLVEPMIKASTSEKGQCPECGAPWVRTTERVDSGRTQKMADGWDTGAGGHNTIHRNGREAGESGVPVMVSQTTGWRPSCSHTAEPVPQTILDPFGGAGTVGLVADRLQRNAILCELKPEYADMGSARITNDAPMFADLDIA